MQCGRAGHNMEMTCQDAKLKTTVPSFLLMLLQIEKDCDFLQTYVKSKIWIDRKTVDPLRKCCWTRDIIFAWENGLQISLNPLNHCRDKASYSDSWMAPLGQPKHSSAEHLGTLSQFCSGENNLRNHLKAAFTSPAVLDSGKDGSLFPFWERWRENQPPGWNKSASWLLW